MNYLLMRARSTGIEIEHFNIRRTLQLEEDSLLMNNFTSLLVITFTLHMANTGAIARGDQTLLSLSIVTVVLHLVKLLINMKNQSSGNLSLDVVVLSMISSVIVKIVSLVSLLSSDVGTLYVVLLGCLMFILALVANYWLENRFLTYDIGDEQKKTFLRAAHSLIFPLALEQQNRKQVNGSSLQLLVGNIAAEIMGFSMALTLGVAEDLFITQNMIKALFCITISLIIYASIVYHGISVRYRLPRYNVIRTQSSCDI